MGPETKNARPSARKFTKYELWRPLAAIVLAASSAVNYEPQSTPNPDLLSTDANHEFLLRPSTIDQINQSPNSLKLDFVWEVQRLRSGLMGQNQTDQNANIKFRALAVQEPLVQKETDHQIEEWLSLGGWPKELISEAKQIAWCESRYNPEVENQKTKKYGLFQLDEMWFDYAGEDFTNWRNPVINSKVAYKVYQYDISRGNTPWTQWLSCKP